MKKHYLIKKIISIIFIILLMIITPVTSFSQGYQVFVYAANIDIMEQGAKLIVPIVAVAYRQINEGIEEITPVSLAQTIDNTKQGFAGIYYTLSSTQKFILGKTTTNLTNAELNQALGTSYSDATIATFGIETLQLKIQNNEELTYWDLQRLGVDKYFAQMVKKDLIENTGTDYGETIQYGSYDVNVRKINLCDFYVAKMNVDSLFNYFPCNVEASQSLSFTLNTVMHYSYIVSNASYLFSLNGSDYKIVYAFYLGDFATGSVATENLSDTSIVGLKTAINYSLNKYHSTYGNYSLAVLYKNVSGNWVKQGYGCQMETVQGKITFLNQLKTYTGIDFTNTIIYTSSSGLDTLIDVTFEGSKTYGDLNQDLEIVFPTAGILSNINDSDTSISQAEKVMSNINSKTDPAVKDYNVKSYPNAETDEPEVIVTPGDTSIPAVDTGANVDTNIPDTTGDIDTEGGVFNIPILGTILAWLKSLVELVRRILDQLMNNSGSTVDEGIDWGNFTGLFDIFYIFWYLIIIVIMILLKFLSVVFNMLSIPANSSLFANYPTMLAGLNYIKNIKVGGFNIILQQIFEYMFTVFFFLFIVTTLQKLYHSFAGIERQTINQEQKWDSNSNVIYRDGNYINTKTGEIQDYKYK